MIKKYFLDTSIIVDCLKGKRGQTDFVSSLKGELSTSYVCLAELFEGIFRVNNRTELEKGLLDFISGLDNVYGLDAEIAKEFGKIRWELKKKGKVIEDLDILIAATCTVNNLTLITSNEKHFGRVNSLQIIPGWRS